MILERKIPNNCSLLWPIMGRKQDDEKHFKKNYIKSIEKFERNVEKSLIKTLSRVHIKGMVKTDPYSLPYNNEIEVTLLGESYLNGAYEVYRVVRPIIKKLLEDDIYQLRFYMFIEVISPEPAQAPGFLPISPMGKVKYNFRYYVKRVSE